MPRLRKAPEDKAKHPEATVFCVVCGKPNPIGHRGLRRKTCSAICKSVTQGIADKKPFGRWAYPAAVDDVMADFDERTDGRGR